jgi:ParB family transcriptional regulator, chromosome partitioning protein
MSELQIQQIPLKKITWGENDRKYFDKQRIIELAATIEAHGILEAVGVKPEGERYIGLWGQRRCLAAEMVGLETVPAAVCAKTMTEAEAREIRLIENVARESLRPLEQAIALQQLMQVGGLSASEVANRVGLNPAAVTKSLALLSLSEPLRDLINSGAISAAAGYELARIDNPQIQAELAREVAAGRLSRDALVGKIKALKRGAPDSSRARARVTAVLDANRSVTLTGGGLCSLETLIQWLEDLLARARKARPQNLELGTFIKMLKDQSRS